MTTRVVAVDPDRPDPATIAEAAAILRSGGLIAFGTETVYGLGADATNPAAVARIFAAKGRPPTNPLIVHAADTDAARACVASWPESAARLADQCWPGPLTLVLPRSTIVPDLVTAGQGTVGIRVPASPVARALINATDRPIAAPSANRSNRISPTAAAHVLKDFDGVIDLILDSGPCSVGIESTVLDLSGQVPTILRPGAVTADQLADLLGYPVNQWGGSVGGDQPAASPGQLLVHYAPKTPAYRLTSSAFATLPSNKSFPARFAMLNLGEPTGRSSPGGCLVTKKLDNPTTAATELYSRLHELDDLGLDMILVVTPPDDAPGWLAVLDRVRRATRPWSELVPGRRDPTQC